MMKKSEFKEFMNAYADCFYEDTSEYLAYEIVRKIMSCKAGECTKLVLVRQYISNLSTNEAVLENISRYNKQEF